MASSQGQRRPAQLGATFYPGGTDDFYMPEVISPAPQRIMPEVPEQMQGNLAHLELEADPRNRMSGLRSPSPIVEMPGSSIPSLQNRYSNLSISTAKTDTHLSHAGSTTVGANQSQAGFRSQEHGRQGLNALDQPTFSPFPPLHNRPANVPPPDAEKEATLENARLPVLSSNDPEMQLTWAQDTLAYVEIAAQNQQRDSDSQESRPQTPRIEYQLRTDAINVVSFLADQHHPKAEFMRGMWLEFGKFNFRMDKKEAYRCYTRAAQKGYARAEYRIGMQFESSNDIAKAIKHYNQGVEAGDSASHYRLGMMTLLGQHGQALDFERGVSLIKFAAETADENAPQGAYVLGMLQAREIWQVNVPEQYLPLNITDSRFNIEKAAYLGFAKAQAKMGLAYELCQLGCDFDPRLSLHYNALAARQGETEAEMSISKWFLCGYEGVFEKNEELAFTYARRAASGGLATAEFAMGYFFEIGVHVSVDLKEAKEWYTKAEDHGNTDAAARIDGIVRSNTLSKKDHANVAIARIRSQYGSQRGKRPERFKNNSTPMPTIPDSNIEMPDPRQSRPLEEVRPYPHPSSEGPPSRPVSITPYPVEDGLDRQPKPRPANMTTYSHPNLRLDPDSRQSSAANFGPAALDGNYRGSSPALMGPHRPSSSTGDAFYGRGRGKPSFNTAPGAQGYRQPSGGLPSPVSNEPGPSNNFSWPQKPGIDVGYVGPQVYRQSGGASTPHSIKPNPPDPPRPQTAGVDIGFSAPPDPSGADRKRRLQKADNSKGGAISSYEAAPHRNSPRISSLPHAQTFSGAKPAPSPSQKPGLPEKHRDTLPNLAGPGSQTQSSGNAPLMPPKTLGSDAVPTTPPPSSTASRPPGKGPKTFEDMNIPQAKKENECILM